MGHGRRKRGLTSAPKRRFTGPRGVNASSLAQFSATCSKQDKRELLARIRNLTALNCTIDLASAMAQARPNQNRILVSTAPALNAIGYYLVALSRR